MGWGRGIGPQHAWERRGGHGRWPSEQDIAFLFVLLLTATSRASIPGSSLGPGAWGPQLETSHFRVTQKLESLFLTSMNNLHIF